MRALLILAGLMMLMLSAWAVETCLECEALQNASSAQMFIISDDISELDITVFYINTSASPSRQPVSDSMVIIEMYNSTGLSLIYKTYTDSEGKASFDYSAWNKGCINFKVLYCPFCLPTSPECGFQECLKFAKMGNTSGYYENVVGEISSKDDIDDGPGGNSAPTALNPQQFKPQLDTESFCPPPPPFSETPALCLPILIIFSLLAGSLYISGRNPFAGFALGTPRIGKHIRYQARGRSMSQNLKSVIMSIAAAVGEQKEVKMKDGTTKKRGELAKPRWFGVDNIRAIGDVIVGTGGRGEESGGGQAATTKLAAGSGRVRRPGIIGAFRQAARDQRAANVRLSGRVQKSSRAGAYFGEIGRNLGVVSLQLFNATWLGYVMGMFGLDRALQKAEKGLTDSVFHQAAARIAESEEFQSVAGRTVTPTSISIADLNNTEVVRTLEDGSEIIRGTNARGETVTIRRDVAGKEFVQFQVGGRTMEIVADSVRFGRGGQISSATYQYRDAETGRVTRFMIENDQLSAVEQVMPTTGGRAEGALAGLEAPTMTVRYRVEQDGSLRVEGFRDSDGQMMQVQRGTDGNITSVGSYSIQRDGSGRVTGMTDTVLSRSVAGGSEAGRMLNTMLQNDGRQMSDVPQILGLDSRAVDIMLRSARAEVNDAFTATTTRYMEGRGLVDVTDHNVLRERGQDSFTIRTLDGDYTATSDHLSADQLSALRRSAAPAVTVTGSEAGQVRSSMDYMSRIAGNIIENHGRLQYSLQTEAGRHLRESNPELFRAITQVQERRQEAAGTFDSAIRGTGASRDVRAAAGAIFNAVNLGYLDTAYSGEAERGRRELNEYTTATVLPGGVKKGEEAPALSPRAQAYANASDAYRAEAAARQGVTPDRVSMDTPEARARISELMQPAVDRIWTAESSEVAGAKGAEGTRRQQAAIDQERRMMSGVMDQRVRDAVGTAMGNSAHLVSSEASAEGSLENAVATNLLRIGTGLATMPDSVALAQVADRFRSDPSISDPNQALELAREYLPRAREVARTFDAAASVTSAELTRSTSTYVQSSYDTAFGQVGAAFRSGGDRARAFSEANDFNARATRYFSTLPPNAEPEQVDRAVGAFMGTYAQRFAADSGDNPLRIGGHQAFAAMMGDVGRPQMDVLHAIGGTAPIGVTSRDAHASQPTYDAQPMRGAIAATYGVYTGLQEHGHELPREAYDQALQGIRAFNGHDLTTASLSFARAATITHRYDSDPEMQGWEQGRREFRESTGHDIGPSPRMRKKKG